MTDETIYADMVRTLAKPGASILADLTPQKADLWHHATGISGEAGELLDEVKKHVIHGKPLDRENMIKEMGDLEFYTEALRQNLGITREEILAHNIAKLSVRYAGLQYSDKSSQDRVDKA